MSADILFAVWTKDNNSNFFFFLLPRFFYLLFFDWWQVERFLAHYCPLQYNRNTTMFDLFKADFFENDKTFEPDDVANAFFDGEKK